MNRHAPPEPIRRLHTPVAARNYDLSGMGAGDDRVPPDNSSNAQQHPATNAAQRLGEVVTHDDDIQVVRNLTLNYFRSKLVTHFDIAYKRHEVKWPLRSGRPEPATDI